MVNYKLEAITDIIEDEFKGFEIWSSHLKDKFTYNEFKDYEKRLKALEHDVLNTIRQKYKEAYPKSEEEEEE